MNPAPISYVEIPAPNLEAAGRFYSQVFGWEVMTSDLGGAPYQMFSTGAGSLMGGLDSSIPVSPQGGLIFYIRVESIDTALGVIQKHGGSAVRPKSAIGDGHGFSATFKDPCGNVIGLWQPPDKQ